MGQQIRRPHLVHGLLIQLPAAVIQESFGFEEQELAGAQRLAAALG
jgi:hypothetical protein